MASMQRLLWVLVWTGAVSAATQPAAAQQRAVVEYAEPISGPPGTQVHLVGRGLAGATAVRLGAQETRLIDVTPTHIRVVLPDGAQSGDLSVELPTGAIRGPAFRVTPPLPAPHIDSFEPRSGSPGTRVTLRGRNFSPRFTGNSVTLSGHPVVIYGATPVSLDVVVPDIAEGGQFLVRVQSAGEAVSREAFEIATKTSIAVVDPRRAAPGATVSIKGTGFSSRSADNRVYLNNVALGVVRSSATEIIVRLPDRIATGDILVDVAGAGRATSPLPFVVQWPPTIVGIAPAAGRPGTRVTLRGTNFGSEAEAIEATIDAVRLPVHEVHRTFMVVEIPDGAPSGTVSVRVHGAGPAWSPQPFRVVTAERPVPAVAGATPPVRSGAASAPAVASPARATLPAAATSVEATRSAGTGPAVASPAAIAPPATAAPAATAPAAGAPVAATPAAAAPAAPAGSPAAATAPVVAPGSSGPPGTASPAPAQPPAAP